MSLFMSSLWAQDIRYSQFFNNPLSVNPALTGSGIEHLRATISYRRQDAGPANPFTTKGASVDKIIGKWGLGFNIHSNGAGDASVKSLNLAGSLSYRLFFGYKSSQELAAGLQMGLLSRSINPAKFTFDNQFNEDIGYDPSIASGETFENNSVVRPSINVGMQWKHHGRKKSAKVRPYLGYAAFHMNRPDVSFFGDEVRYDIKHSINAGADIRISEELLIKPSILHTQQGPFNETVFGVLGNYQHGSDNQIQAGLFGKAGRAFVFYAGYQMDRFLVGMSYDVASGPIHEAGKGYNAFELSLTFTPKAKEKPAKTEKAEVKRKEPEQQKANNQKPVDKKESPSEKQKPSVTPVVVVKPNETLHQPVAPTTEPKQQITAVMVEPKPVDAAMPVPQSIDQPSIQDVQPIAPAVSAQPQETPAVAPAETIVPTAIEAPALTNTPTVDPSGVQVSQQQAVSSDVKKPSALPSQQPTTATITPAVSQVMPEEKVVVSETPSVPNTVTDIQEPTVETAVVPSVFSPIVPNKKMVAPDSDQDGVNDFEDPCPYIKGTLATRGCPDTDDDGLVDMVDFCPLESGPKTNGGCPVLTSRKNTDQQIVSGFDHVLFNTGSITLTIDNTYDIIERAIDYLFFDKSTYVLISGHTDDEGDAASNMELSQKRADKVKSYFVGQGISESRIKTIPYGENMPIGGNDSDASRKMNRRVEITILKRGE